MNKRIIFSMLIFFFLMPLFVNASGGSLVKVGNKYYDSFEEALANVGPNDTISLLTNIKTNKTIEINKPININLNGNTITAPEKVFLVQGGTLNLTGTGIIKETNPNYGAIMVIGSTSSDEEDYSVVNVGEEVTLEGWSGIFITHNNQKSYGTKVNFSGKINAVNDTSGGTGIGIYVNGNIKDDYNAPIVNINNNANIKSTGNGLYIAGYAVFNIKKSYISGVESGIGIKSGILNIDGATVEGTGPDVTPTEGYNNGIKASGTAIQIESNSGYAGDIEINIDNGTFKSNNSYTIYEYIGKGTSSQVIALDISGGKYTSGNSKNNFLISNSLTEYHHNFISCGEYSNDPTEYLKPGYSAVENKGLYEVTQSTILSVFKESTFQNNNIVTTIIVVVLIFTIIISLYLNKTKILNNLKNNLKVL